MRIPRRRRPALGPQTVTHVGLDLAKRVFQVHAVDAKGEIVAACKLAPMRHRARELLAGQRTSLLNGLPARGRGSASSRRKSARATPMS